MKTLQQLYTEIMGSDELKKAYLEAAKGGKVAEFLKAQGCEATAEEIKTFLVEKSSRQLSDAELDSVAGGECNDSTKEETIWSICSVGIICAAMAIVSGSMGDLGQKKEGDGRICNV